MVNDSVVVEISEGSLDPQTPYVISGKNLRIKNNIPAIYLDKAMRGRVTLSGLERGILNINDIPGISGTKSFTW